jgi:hypothetical protein
MPRQRLAVAVGEEPKPLRRDILSNHNRNPNPGSRPASRGDSGLTPRTELNPPLMLHPRHFHAPTFPLRSHLLQPPYSFATIRLPGPRRHLQKPIAAYSQLLADKVPLLTTSPPTCLARPCTSCHILAPFFPWSQSSTPADTRREGGMRFNRSQTSKAKSNRLADKVRTHIPAALVCPNWFANFATLPTTLTNDQFRIFILQFSIRRIPKTPNLKQPRVHTVSQIPVTDTHPR